MIVGDGAGDVAEVPADVTLRRHLGSSRRLAALARAEAQLAPLEDELDALARLAAAAAGTDVGLVSLVEPGGQVCIGRSCADLPRRPPLPADLLRCAHVVVARRPALVPDCAEDPWFAAHPSELARAVRAYAGVPVADADGEVVGTVCAVDSRPRPDLGAHLDALTDVARQVSALLVAGRRQAEQGAQRRVLAAVAAGRPLPAVLQVLTAEVETLLGAGARCTVLLDTDRDRLPAPAAAALPVLRPDERPVGTLALFRAGAAEPSPSEWATLRDFRDLAALAVQRSRAQSELTRLATRDTVTGLLNRAAFLAGADEAVSRPPLPGRTHVLLLADVDRFTVLNDSLGQAAGDAYLGSVAHELRARLRPHDLVCRYAGDAFAVLTRDVAVPDVPALLERAAAAFAQPVRLAGHELVLTASVGAATSDLTGPRVEALVRDADLAMHAAKAAGRARVRVCDAALQAEARSRSDVLLALREALAAGRTTVAYQPEVDLETGVLLGVEALCRWDRPGHGPVSPADFVPLAEGAGLVEELGERVLATAVADLASWRAQLPAAREVAVWVNVSAHQLGDRRLVDVVDSLLRRHGLPPGCLGLEVTESAVMADPETARAALGALRALGVRIAIDDFGTGYSSLSALKRLPVDLLKIDRSFVRGLPADGSDRQIVAAIVAMGGAMGLPVLAEGVETPEQRSALLRLGCGRGQGFELGAPQPAAALRALLAR
ncbi:putative bifunctional diguanylate cyclase/phosphodiesterase [Kineococcus glutinatus]|uniref:Diguanylate cyclase (GGDEF)-like protein n=1 Tax=Kineococcus glutinatus TaxID=1070872 RepID=A0ABP8VCU4_9ACTN